MAVAKLKSFRKRNKEHSLSRSKYPIPLTDTRKIKFYVCFRGKKSFFMEKFNWICSWKTHVFFAVMKYWWAKTKMGGIPTFCLPIWKRVLKIHIKNFFNKIMILWVFLIIILLLAGFAPVGFSLCLQAFQNAQSCLSML